MWPFLFFVKNDGIFSISLYFKFNLLRNKHKLCVVSFPRDVNWTDDWIGQVTTVFLGFFM